MSLTKACWLRNDRVVARLPIHKDFLGMILRKTDNWFLQRNQSYLSLLYCTLFSTAYFGLFRVGELTTGTHPVLVSDVHIGENKNKFLFILRTSKTHCRSVKPQRVKISSVKVGKSKNHTEGWCPFHLLQEFMMWRPQYKSCLEPFFIFRDGTAVTPHHMRLVLKLMIDECHIDSKIYSTHSLRTGRALDLLKIGLSVETIKKLGRWKSNAVFAYLC